MASPEKMAARQRRQEKVTAELAARGKMREDAIALLAAAPRYPRPANDPAIVELPSFPSIKLVDSKTGDFFLIQLADREEEILYFSFWTKDEKYVCTFETKFGPGEYGRGDWPPYPIRVYGMQEAKAPTAAVIAARNRISVARFAQFLTVLPRFNGKTGTDYVVIDAPIQPGERM